MEIKKEADAVKKHGLEIKSESAHEAKHKSSSAGAEPAKEAEPAPADESLPPSESEIISCYDKRFEDLTLADDFMFKLIFEDPNLCRQLIEIILGKKVVRLVSLETEKTLNVKFFSHGVRFDVYVEGEDEVIDIEIQRGDKDDLAKRARSYQSNIDVDMLKRGKKYSSLKESYVIFFCAFDPFGLGEPVYTVEQIFKEARGKNYNDGTHKIFYNCTAYEKCADAELRAVLKLLMGKSADSKFTHTLTREMKQRIANTDIRSAFMGIEEIISKKAERNRSAWLAEGISQGITQGDRNAKISTARNFRAMGVLTIEQIALGTGLSVEEVAAL